jgi:hypothetical protein
MKRCNLFEPDGELSRAPLRTRSGKRPDPESNPPRRGQRSRADRTAAGRRVAGAPVGLAGRKRVGNRYVRRNRRQRPLLALQVLDLLLAFFADGAQWMHGEFRDGNGNRCLFDALHQLRRKHGIRGDGTGYYLRDAMPRRRELAWFNDDC